MPTAAAIPGSPSGSDRVARSADLIREAVSVIRAAGGAQARRDAGLLLAHVLGTEAWRPTTEPDGPVTAEQASRFFDLVERRTRHEPVAYILGEREFWNRTFEVGPGVLVPRPETECLVEAALGRLGRPDPLVADLGTGSGCIAVSLAAECPGARVVATDTSGAALQVAARNAARHGMDGRIEFRQGAGPEPLHDLAGRIDLLVSNPPYVSEAEWQGLEPQVRDWEPREALVPGPTGLEALEWICEGAYHLLAPDGWLLLEIGAGQADAVRGLLEGWALDLLPDLAGIPRVAAARVADGGEVSRG